jgi:hypothetical protein
MNGLPHYQRRWRERSEEKVVGQPEHEIDGVKNKSIKKPRLDLLIYGLDGRTVVVSRWARWV